MQSFNTPLPLTYDQAKNHFLSNFPESLPIEQAYVHIGIYLGWIIENQLYSASFEDESSLQIHRFLHRQVSCTILSEVWDGALDQEMLNEEGNKFTRYYYQSGTYLADYQSVIGMDLPTIYHVADTWENYSIMAKQIDLRYQTWKKDIFKQNIYK